MNFFSTKTLLIVLTVLVVVLAIGQIYLLTKISSPSGTAALTTQSPLASSATPGSNTNGPVAGSATDSFAGTVVSISGGALTVKTDSGSKQVSVPSGTPVLLEGAQKTTSAMQKDLDTFSKTYAELYKNADGNKDKIGALLQPLGFDTSTISLSDIHVGDEVAIAAKGSTALRVVKLKATSTQ